MASILIIDDEPIEAEHNWKDMLEEDYHWKVDIVASYAAALTYLETETPDVILLDRMMDDPKTGEKRTEVGDELLETIIARWPDICVIMLTNNVDLESAKQDTRRGAYDYFEKKVTTELLHLTCLRGIEWRKMENRKYKLFSCETLDDLLNQSRQLIHDCWPNEISLAFLIRSPGGSFRFMHPFPDACMQNLEQNPFLDQACIANVLENCVPVLKDIEREPLTPLLDAAAKVQLIAPILKDGQCLGLIWIESRLSDALDRDRRDMIQGICRVIGERIEEFRTSTLRRSESAAAARQAIVDTTAFTVREPLEDAQLHLDFLRTTIEKSTLDAPTLRSSLNNIALTLDQALQAALQLQYDFSSTLTDKQAIDVLELVEQRVAAYSPQAESNNCRITLKCVPTLKAPVLASLDPIQIRYSLDAIFDNAIDAIDERRKTDDPTLKGIIDVRLLVENDRRDILLLIVDNGCGIKRELLPRVFDRYFTTKPHSQRERKQSFTLGHIKQVVEDCGGVMEICNAPKGGLEVSLVFPVAKSATNRAS